MKVQGLYAAVYVGDLARATAWYSKVFGREPDDKPNPTLVQWRGFGDAGVQLFEDAAKAGKGVMTLVVPDMAATQSLLAAASIDLGDVRSGAFGKIAHLADPDGNTITLAEPPKS